LYLFLLPRGVSMITCLTASLCVTERSFFI
jgi:hypothetical protein